MLCEEFDYKASFRTSIRSAGRTFFHSIASMTYFTKLFMAVFCAATLHATAADERVARTMAGKDYQVSLEKIRADELAALGECAKKPGPAANACMVQANGKRMRAEQEAKEKMDRVGQAAPLPDAQTKVASKTAIEAAKKNRSTTGKSIDAETKTAKTECRRLSGDQRTACMEDVAKRRQDAADWADALYKKARSDAKSMKAP